MTMPHKVLQVSIVYPADPLGNIPGGIDTWIKGVLRWAPEDISFSVLGATTDRKARPVGQWLDCELKRPFRFYPLIAIDNPGKQTRIPATVKYMAAMAMRNPRHQFDVLEFHRLEPSLFFLSSPARKIAYVHQDMASALKNTSSDIRWKYMPGLYHWLEYRFLKRFDAAFVVHEQAVKNYKARYPDLAGKFRFLPTWMDPDIFYPISSDKRAALKNELCTRENIKPDRQILIWVGRLDRQKNPLRMIECFNILSKQNSDVHLAMIGDGVLRKDVEDAIAANKLNESVSMLGLLPNHLVGDWLRAGELLVLSSDYEGMPICVIEAMGCGTPAAVTDVGEVRKVVNPGQNGEIAAQRSAQSLADAIDASLKKIKQYQGQLCLEVAANFVPSKVLAPVYDRYRALVYTKANG